MISIKLTVYLLQKYRWFWIFLLPMLILFFSFTIYPLIASVYYTFFNWDGIGSPTDFVGLRHYVRLATDPFFWNAFKNTFLYTAIVVPVQLSFALGLAIILDSRWLRAKQFFQSALISPIVISPAILGTVISMLITVGGVSINNSLIQAGMLDRPIDWLGNPRTALWIVVAVGIWLGIGYPLIYFLAALQMVDRDLYDAARVDGGGSWVLFRHVTLPGIRSIALIIFFITTLHNLRVFDIVQVLTRGGPYFATEVVSTYIYRYAFYMNEAGDSEANLGYASAAAFFMGLLVMVISVVQLMLFRRLNRKSREI